MSFQRRHLLAHAMGVIDQAYVSQTGEDPARVGRRIEVSALGGGESIGVTAEVERLALPRALSVD